MCIRDREYVNRQVGTDDMFDMWHTGLSNANMYRAAVSDNGLRSNAQCFAPNSRKFHGTQIALRMFFYD